MKPASRAATAAGKLSHGEKRQLEIAIALALKPRLMLLDEPFAGLGPDETRAGIALLAALKGEFLMLLIERDIDAVFAHDDEIGVMVDGRLIAWEPPTRSARAPPCREPTSAKRSSHDAPRRGDRNWLRRRESAARRRFRPRWREALALLGRNGMATLSAGEPQMLAIGRALMTNPKLIVPDEATEGLAPLVRAEIWECLKRLKAEGLTILVIDNLSGLRDTVDRIAVNENGRIVWRGAAGEFRSHRTIVERFLHVGGAVAPPVV